MPIWTPMGLRSFLGYEFQKCLEVQRKPESESNRFPVGSVSKVVLVGLAGS